MSANKTPLKFTRDAETSTIVPSRLSEHEVAMLDRLVDDYNATSRPWPRFKRSTLIARLIDQAHTELMKREAKKDIKNHGRRNSKS